MTFESWFPHHDVRARWRYAMLALAGLLSVITCASFYTHRALMHHFDPARDNPPEHVVILTTSWCPYCKALRQALDEAKLRYDEIDVEQDWRTGYAYYATYARGVPVTVIGSEKFIGGLSEQLVALHALCQRTNGLGRYDCGGLDAALTRWRRSPTAGFSQPDSR